MGRDRRIRSGPARFGPAVLAGGLDSGRDTRAAPPAAPPLVLGPGLGRSNPRPHPGLGTQASEQADLRALQDLELSIARVDPELVEGKFLRFVDGAASRLHPLHL